MAKFVIKDGDRVRTQMMDKESATVIVAGDLVAKDSNGYAVVADANSTKIAWAPKGAAAGDLSVEVTEGNVFTLKATSDTNFALTDKGSLVDINTTTQTLNIGTATNSQLRISPFADAGLDGTLHGSAASASNVEVKIYSPLF